MFKVHLLVFAFLLSTAYAQEKVIGLYMSAADFSKRKVLTVSKGRVKLHDVFYKPYIELIIGKKVEKFSKDSIFGYLTENRISYRFYKREEYPIYHAGRILLYKTQPLPGKADFLQPLHFFSKSPTDSIYKLSKKNLKEVYSDNKLFIDLLDQYFSGDEDLNEYDPSEANYRIEKILQISQKQQ